MVVGVMGAMPEEIDPILKRLENVKKHEVADNVYYTAFYGSLDLVVAYSKIGKVFSALTAATMIEKFGVQKMLFSGVAGAISPALHIGDLVAATKLCQHDLDITAFGHPYGYVPEGKVYVEADPRLLEIAASVAYKQGVKLKRGIIATGDQFVADAERKAWIGQTFNADALEMEGASVAVVCDALGVPFFVLRAISDAADMDAGFDFDAFLQSSAVKSADFIFMILDELDQA
ncbi:5'-methylthioadenosine/adenosylhomocysteine nucleosidase [Hydrogenimonas cancrithermarum]|uniref:adenosylhomocysteine nucleosidase n=1 Tax=Hydrogenimonas cancrithermarum TaxID=2993563 RepID=A0ABM8FJ62_9BACT|nr:5'-methylthioadenosine/adenosylhomocysteine nucleosidase [Hydrogenimonas cancrithermarum]BDY12329.1 aminodeoxyfutalosine nucleosidase [Hydrogenimonas cancrithermarum]